MAKRLNDSSGENRKVRPALVSQVLPIQFNNDEATKRIVRHTVKRVILRHKDELYALAYK
nr:hypothetical protein [Acinetobacter sp. neg1]